MKFYKLIIFAILLSSCIHKVDYSDYGNKAVVRNLIDATKQLKTKNPDLFFDSLGYKWASDGELKDSILKYKSSDSILSKSFYYIIYQSDTIHQIGFTTYNFNDYKSAIKEAEHYHYRKYADNIMNGTILNFLSKKDTLLCFLKEKRNDSTIYHIIMQRKHKS